MMWVEILSRHRDVASRVRIAGTEARIGRGYDNDIVVDDPYVAAQHVRIFRDDAGQLVAEDLGSANGTFLDGSKTRLARIVLDGTQPIRIGHTYVRVRDTSHAVERERVAPSEIRALPVVIAVVLGALIVAVELLHMWLVQTSEPKASSYLSPVLGMTAVTLGWVGMWALLSRIFAGRSHVLRNMLIPLAGVLAVSLYNEFANFAAFAWTWPVASDYAYAVLWVGVAVVCFLHLREISRSRLWLKGALVTVLFATIIGVQTLQQSEAFSDAGRRNTARQLFPPALRLAPVRDEGAFFADIAKLRSKLDDDRARGLADEADR
jgi:FHA domain-containing protein